MAVLNRDLDPSQQKDTFTNVIPSVTNGVTYGVMVVPYNGIIKAVSVTSIGVSGAPLGFLEIGRWIPSTGFTVVTGLAATMTMLGYGTSGPYQASLVAAGSTLLNVQANDLLMIRSVGGTGAAATSINVSVVLQSLNDIKTIFGSSS